MWILTEDNTMINTDNITYMDIEETEKSVYIKSYFNVSSGSLLSDRTYTNFLNFCILDNTENNKNVVKRIFLEIFDSIKDQKVFNVSKRLIGKN